MSTTEWIVKKLGEAGIKVAETPEKGRHCIAARDFAQGSVILEADPEIDAPFGGDISTHCSNCYKCLPGGVDFETASPDVPPPPEYRCPACKAVYYCSEECRTEHWRRIHHKECNAIGSLTEMSIIIERVLNLGVDWEFLRPAPSFDPKQMSEEYTSMFESLRTAMAGYEGFEAPDDKTLFLLTETINNNAFAIEDSATNPAGTGVYILASLFSHSCVANTSRAFRGKTLFILASCDIKAGEEITVTYSSNIFNTVNKRREELYSHYGFTCACPRCAAEADESSAYYKKISGGLIPSEEAVIPLEALTQVRDALIKKADAEDYKGEHDLIATIIPPGAEIPESYISCLSFAFIIEKACVACNRLGLSEDELYYTKLYGKCSECKYTHKHNTHKAGKQLQPHKKQYTDHFTCTSICIPIHFLNIFLVCFSSFLFEEYTHLRKHFYKLWKHLLQYGKVRRGDRALQGRRRGVQGHPPPRLCCPRNYQR